MPPWAPDDTERGRRGCRWRSYAVVVTALLLVSATAAAAGVSARPSDIARSSSATPVSECTTIDAPGAYVVTADLRPPPDTRVCLRVRASDVRLRGNGHRLVGRGSGLVGVGVGSRAGVSNVTVENVTVTGWRVGVGFAQVDGGSVVGVEARRNEAGVRLARTRGVRVRDGVAIDNEAAGVRISDGSVDSAVVGLTTSENRWGVAVEGSTGTDVVDGRFLADERGGVSIRAAPASTLRGNTIESGRYGVEVADSPRTRLLNTTVERPREAGIEVTNSRNVTVVDANVSGGGVEGVELFSTSGSLLRDVRVEGSEVGVSVSRSRSTDIRAVTAVDTSVGIRLSRARGTHLRDVRIREVGSTSFSEESVGVHLTNSAENALVNTTVVGDAGSRTSLGVHVEGGVGNRLSTLTVSDTRQALWFEDGEGHEVVNATVERNTDPLSVRGTTELSLVDATFRGNDERIDAEGATGLRLVGARVVRNDVRGRGPSLELVGDDLRIEQSVVTDNDGGGVALIRSDDSVVTDTVVRGNAGEGLRLSGTSDARVTNVTASNNEGHGITVAASEGDWGQDPLTPSNNTLATSAVTENFGDGVVVTDASNTEIRGVRAVNNRAGVRIEASPRTTVADTTTRTNAESGISVADGSTGSRIVGVDTVRNAQVGLSVTDSDDVTILDTRAHRNFDDGIDVGGSDGLTVESVDATDNGWNGLLVGSSRDVDVTNATAIGNQADGLSLWGVERWAVTDSVATDNGDAGISPIGSDDGAAVDNRVFRNDQGIWASGENNSYTDNVARRNEMGFLVSSRGRSVLRNNSAVENAELGVRTSGRAVVADNEISENGAGVRNGDLSHAGLAVSANVFVTGNRIVDNDGVGVLARETNNTIRDNRIAGNTAAGVELVGTTNATVADNRISANEHGVVVGFARQSDRQGRSITPSLATTIEDNVVENRRVNVLVQGGADTRLVDNRLVDGRVGVRVEPITFLGPGRAREATGVDVHGNLLAGNRAFGVENTGRTVVDATGNDWGAPDGPSSPNDPDAPFTDPVTGAVADGRGDAVSENRTVPGVSNVRFDPYVRENASAVRNEHPVDGG